MEFGPYTLDIEHRELRRDGDVVILKPKEMEILLALAEAYPGTVKKEALLSRVWADGDPSDAALSQTIYRLRKTLSDPDGDTFQYVCSVPRIGLRLARPPARGRHVREFDREAFALYRRAVFYARQKSESSLLKSIELFHAAERLEPGYLPAILGLARAYTSAGIRLVLPPQVAYDTARALILRALELEPHNAEIFAVRGIAEIFFRSDYALARHYGEHARALDTACVSAYTALAWAAIASNDVSAAYENVDTALRLDPSSASVTTLLGTVMYMTGRLDDAEKQFAQALEFLPDYAPALFHRACICYTKGDYARALVFLERIPERDLAVRAQALRGMISAKVSNGERFERSSDIAGRDSELPLNLSAAAIRLALGDVSGANHLIEAAVKRQEPALFYALRDPIYADFQMRGDQRLLKQLRDMFERSHPL